MTSGPSAVISLHECIASLMLVVTNLGGVMRGSRRTGGESLPGACLTHRAVGSVCYSRSRADPFFIA